MATPDPDLDLVRELRAGNDAAFDRLMDRHKEALYRFIFRHIPNQADALEITQEAFVRAYFHIQQFRPRAKFSTWLHRIALNLCRDFVRSRSTRQSRQTVPIEDSQLETIEGRNYEKPDTKVQYGEEVTALEQAIDSLPNDLKSPLILMALEQRSQAETAELLRISPKAVEMKVYRARRLLLEKMRKMGF